MLDIQNLSAGYSSPIVKDVSLSLQPGQILGLLGRNGSGKTTLLRGLSGSAKVTAGKVLLDGQDLLSLKPRQRARCMALLSQRTPQMDGLTVAEVIRMGRFSLSGPLGRLSAKDEALCKKAAEDLGVFPLWDRDCSALSEGQRQLVHLARVTAQDARVLLLDEPSSALDFENAHRLFSQVRRIALAQQKSVVIVLHDPALALGLCDRLARMENGRLTGVLDLPCRELSFIEEFLSPLCPGIRVKTDPETGSFYCIMANTGF